MVAAADGITSQARVFSVGGGADASVSQGTVVAVGDGAGDSPVSQSKIYAVANFPSEEGSVSQAYVSVVGAGVGEASVSQARIFVVGRGKIQDPQLKAWAYTLDGHDNVVLRLGNDGKTLVFDISTNTWNWWASQGTDRWRPQAGFNWRTSGSMGSDYGSVVIVGDDSAGILWVLDPEYGVDDALSGDNTVTFERVATGQAKVLRNKFKPVYSVYLNAAVGSPSVTANTVTLEYSDDQGNTYVQADEPMVSVSGSYNQQFTWRSMGVARAPGRLFRITDDGAFKRIDSMDVNEEDSR